ncbi:hypothetical protein C2G38_2085824 [Gigaspora rosea]|uniref:Ubiquitin-like domain-containing protein n=1 Tax=Gigaspora rosea TaxID=44941 RepID=A0A397VEM1_9GLOM|nr:hypothetical protein C2G38_2085824 [Gigaspora rosea]
MKCTECGFDKLSREFPSDIISKRCNHIPTWCLKCLLNHLLNNNANDKHELSCPQCNATLTQNELSSLKLTWEKVQILVEVPSVNVFKNDKVISEEKGEFYVALLNGQKYTIRLEQVKTVRELKQVLTQMTGIESRKQKLIFDGVELKVLKNTKFQFGGDMKLIEYGIREGSLVQLIVVLYSITKEVSISNLSFDLHWGFPLSGVDYLDGTCLIYAGNVLWKKYDYSSPFDPNIPYIKHSGDIINMAAERGRHIITIQLDQLPMEITKLYFILSAWGCPNIGHFRNPSFLLYDEDSPKKDQLCDYSIQTAATSQAVIMCYVARSMDDCWEVIPVGKLSNGNALNYHPIKSSINEIEKNIRQQR